MSDAKQAARLTLMARRRAISPADRTLFDAALIDQLLSFLDASGATRVAAYHPVGDEPGGERLIPALADATERLYLPISATGGRLEWGTYTPGAELVAGSFGIPEPHGDERVPEEEVRGCDLIIVPTLGLNSAGVRLGKGGGYYDRFLAAAPTAPTVCLVYPTDLVDDFPVEPHDRPVTAAFTPSGRLVFRP